MCPPGGHPIPSADARLSSRHSISQTSSLCTPGRWGGGAVSVFHHSDQACPHSSFISSKPAHPAGGWPGRVRAARRQPNRCPLLQTRQVVNVLFISTPPLKNNSRERKRSAGSCQGGAFIRDIFDVRSAEVTATGKEAADPLACMQRAVTSTTATAP